MPSANKAAPCWSAMAEPMTSATNATSERVASSHENSTSGHRPAAWRTASVAVASTVARSMRSL